MKLNLAYLEELKEIISSNDCFFKKKKKVDKTKKPKGYRDFSIFCVNTF